MITIKCPVCSVGYDNYEDKSFIAGHNMCVDCYENMNTPNMPKSWKKKFDEDYTSVSTNGFDNTRFIKVNADVIKQFISDLRKQDEEELIKMLPKYSPFRDLTSSTINQCVDNFKKTIQDYYSK